MRKTVNVNIGSLPFTLNDDAYEVLNSYLSDIEHRLGEDDKETLKSVERRIANMLDARLSESVQVVDLNMVADAKVMIGAPETFEKMDAGSVDEFTDVAQQGEISEDADDVVANHNVNKSEERPLYNYPKYMYRSRNHRIIGGVCGGLSKYTNTSVGRVRFTFVILLAAGLVSLYIYLLLWCFAPLDPAEVDNSDTTDDLVSFDDIDNN